MLLSEGEKSWIREGFECNVRNDGRKCLDLRTAVIEIGLISSASGSARVRLGSNDVIVGVKVPLPPFQIVLRSLQSHFCTLISQGVM